MKITCYCPKCEKTLKIIDRRGTEVKGKFYVCEGEDCSFEIRHTRGIYKQLPHSKPTQKR